MRTEIEEFGSPAARPARRVVSGPRHHVDLAAHEGAHVVARHEHGVPVVHGIARVAAHPQQCGFRPVVVADHGDVHLAVPVHLHRCDHGVAHAPIDDVEDPLVGHEPLDLRPVVAARAHGHRLADQVGFPSVIMRSGAKVDLAREGRQPGHQADAGDHGLALAAKRFRGGADAQFRKRVRHRGPGAVPARWNALDMGSWIRSINLIREPG